MTKIPFFESFGLPIFHPQKYQGFIFLNLENWENLEKTVGKSLRSFIFLDKEKKSRKNEKRGIKTGKNLIFLE